LYPKIKKDNLNKKNRDIW